MHIYQCLVVDYDGNVLKDVGYCTDIDKAEEMASAAAGDSAYWQVRLVQTDEENNNV